MPVTCAVHCSPCSKTCAPFRKWLWSPWEQVDDPPKHITYPKIKLPGGALCCKDSCCHSPTSLSLYTWNVIFKKALPRTPNWVHLLCFNFCSLQKTSDRGSAIFLVLETKQWKPNILLSSSCQRAQHLISTLIPFACHWEDLGLDWDCPWDPLHRDLCSPCEAGLEASGRSWDWIGTWLELCWRVV